MASSFVAGCVRVVAVIVALNVAPLAVSCLDLGKSCPGNLVHNGGFEAPNTAVYSKYKDYKALNANNGWGWYTQGGVPYWYNTCARVDWAWPLYPKWIEIHRHNYEYPPEGKQNAELLPNATGVICQDIYVQKGATYKLSFYYGRLETTAWRPPYVGKYIKFQTRAVAAVRAKSAVPKNPGIFYGAGVKNPDLQNYKILVEGDTTKFPGLWKQYTATFVAPDNRITLAFINTKRPKECGSCGSLLDAVCLQKVSAAAVKP